MDAPVTVDWTAARLPAAAAQPPVSLRERKKARTRQRLSDTATQMFLARGFDAVRVTEIAAACEVSEKTVYNYFPTKESLVLDRWASTAQALRAALADSAAHPVDAIGRVLSGELTALMSWLAAQDDPAAAVESVRQFSELVATTPALRAYNNEVMNELVGLAAERLALRAGLAADDPEPRIAATALIGLWGVHFAALDKHLHGTATPAAVYAAIRADVDAAARLLRTGLASWPPA
jgi:AcrR family transcriptional regulator